MSYTVTATFSDEQRKVEGTYPVTMYVINASQSGFDPLYYINHNINVYGYSVNSSGSLCATEALYIALSVERDAIKTDVQGEIPEVSISVPNVDRAVESVIQSQNYLRGRDVHIISMFAKHLPTGTGPNYIGASPDKNAHMKEKMFVDSVTSDENVVTFMCKPKFILNNIVLPRRKYTRECSWEYNSTECSVTGAVFSSYPTCGYTLASCIQRSNSSRFGGFPGLPNRGILL
jgi:lambda family phage minor tail protein L